MNFHFLRVSRKADKEKKGNQGRKLPIKIGRGFGLDGGVNGGENPKRESKKG